MPRRTTKRIVDFLKNSNDSEEKNMGTNNNSLQGETEVLSLLRKISNQLNNIGVNQGTQSAEQSLIGQVNNQSTDAAGIQALYHLLQQGLGKQGNSQPANQGQTTNQQDVISQDKKELTKDTAQQILEQAQYELANELEASLKKLKEVISESENLAAKISALIGQDSHQTKP